MSKNNNYRIKTALFWILTITVMAVIFAFSAQNSENSGNQSSFITDILMKLFSGAYRNSSYDEKIKIIESMEFAIRKLAHFSIYSILGMFSYIAVYYSTNFSKKSFAISLLICFIYACTDEIHQLFVSGRSCQLRDVFIDFSGAIFMTAISISIKKFYNHKKRK